MLNSYEWQAQAMCKDKVRLFDNTSDKNALKKAKEICVNCNVFLECRALADSIKHKYGTWAGVGYKDNVMLNSNKQKNKTNEAVLFKKAILYKIKQYRKTKKEVQNVKVS
jgi:hypothetical protein